jgi:alkylation response protein AidB-like acyl-CoA dehydrogenase
MTIVSNLCALVPWMQKRAAQLDDDARFPDEEVVALRRTGALNMPLPIEHHEDGASVDALTDDLSTFLMQIGAGNLAVGRIIEAHINARHLIARYGSPQQIARAADDLRMGHLFALWVTDPPQGGLRMTHARSGIRLDGGKIFCSGAGHATRALVTATDDAGNSHMLVFALGAGESAGRLEAPLQGMRAAVTGAVDFTGCLVDPDVCLGNAGDYLREPAFSTGAWRGSAVATGGLQSLVALMKDQLKGADRIGNPHQLQRLGTAMIECETCCLWVRRAARIAEEPTADPDEAVAYVGLARIAVETACLDAMRLVQRSLGLSAFRHGNPVERICRDLGTYLRQPAPDAVLTEAAAHFARHPEGGEA